MKTDSTKFFVTLFAYSESETNGVTIGKWSKKAIYECGTKDEAIKLFHQTLASYINSDTYCQCTVILTDVFGNQLRSEYWAEPVETPTPEESLEPSTPVSEE